MADIAATLRAGLEARGWTVHALEIAPLSARFTVSDPATGQDCEVDVLKEIFWRPFAQSPYGPVLAEEDVIGIKIRALADRGAPRDLIDVFAASRRWTNAELEEFGRRHARGRFEREDLQSNLTGAEWTDDEAFAAYGLDDAAITALRTRVSGVEPVQGEQRQGVARRDDGQPKSLTVIVAELCQRLPGKAVTCVATPCSGRHHRQESSVI